MALTYTILNIDQGEHRSSTSSVQIWGGKMPKIGSEVETNLAHMSEGLEALCDLQRVFNCDKTSFTLDTGTERSTQVCHWGEGPEACAQEDPRNQATDHHAGVCKHSRRIHRYYDCLSREMHHTVYEPWGIPRSCVAYAVTDSGWMNSNALKAWLLQIKELMDNKNIKKPVTLFTDGYKGHTSYEVTTAVSIWCIPSLSHFL